MGEEWTPAGGRAPSDEPARRDRRLQTRIVLAAVTLVLLIWFAVANFQDVKIRFWVTTTSAPLIVVIVISGFLGAAAAGTWSRIRRRRRRPAPSDDRR